MKLILTLTVLVLMGLGLLSHSPAVQAPRTDARMYAGELGDIDPKDARG